jgi:hypothetical protein
MDLSSLNKYLQEPSEQNFSDLWKFLEANDEKAYTENCRNVVYEIWKNVDSLRKQHKGVVQRHIAILFQSLGRFIEAEYFLNQYLSMACENVDTVSRLQFLSVKRSHVNDSLKYLRLIEDLSASPEVFQHALVLHLLLIDNEYIGREAEKLLLLATEVRHLYTVFEAALRGKDGYLLSKVLQSTLGNDLLESSSVYHKGMIDGLVRKVFIELLLTRINR